MEKVPITGMAHITGGGIEGNLKRILPDGCQAVIDTASWPSSRSSRICSGSVAWIR